MSPSSRVMPSRVPEFAPPNVRIRRDCPSLHADSARRGSALAKVTGPIVLARTMGPTYNGLPITAFAFPGELRDQLTALVLAGTKVATASLVADYILEGDAIPRPGD